MLGLTSADALTLVERLASVAVIISATESLAGRSNHRDDGLCSWQVFQLSRRWMVSRPFQRSVGWLLEYPRVLSLFVLQLILGVLFLLQPDFSEITRAMLCSAFVVSWMLVSLRSAYGRDGADHMLVLIFGAAALGHFAETSQGRTIALGFIAFQSCLAYFTAGVAKLLSPAWRDGRALPEVLRTETYGLGQIVEIFDRLPWLATMSCWATIVFEMMFPMVLIGGSRIAVGLLMLGVVFHLGTVVLMRLNTFIWAFVATYPAILFIGNAWS